MGQEVLWKVWNGSVGPPGGPGLVGGHSQGSETGGRSSGRSETGKEVLRKV